MKTVVNTKQNQKAETGNTSFEHLSLFSRSRLTRLCQQLETKVPTKNSCCGGSPLAETKTGRLTAWRDKAKSKCPIAKPWRTEMDWSISPWCWMSDVAPSYLKTCTCCQRFRRKSIGFRKTWEIHSIRLHPQNPESLSSVEEELRTNTAVHSCSWHFGSYN